MRTRFDQVAKQIGKEALGRSGPTVVHHEISPEPQYADLHHEPHPARQAERKRLGLLGRIAAVHCLIEIYSHAPSAEELRACLAKHLASWQQRARKTRADNTRRRKQRQPPKPFREPFLWLVTAGAPVAILTKLKLERAPRWPAGVYFFGDDILRVGLVVASELPRVRSTLLIRLMAAGPLLKQAIEDLGALPANAHERAVVERILLDLHHVLQQKPTRTREEKEFVVTMYNSWEDIRIEARTEARARAVLTVLRARGIAVPVAARKRILAQKNLKQLERWLAKASVASSIEEVLGTRS
jgi:hypothetical protein